MSSDDVIELGSSDEETEPAPKRSKPMLNAMVCIPRTLHDVTIKPAKVSPVAIPKGLLGTAITVKKVTSGKPDRNKVNGKPSAQPFKPKIAINPYSDRLKPVFIANKPSNSKLTIVKPGNIKTVVHKPNLPFLKAPIKIQNPKALTLPPSTLTLPPSITVKKTMSNRPIVMLNVKGKQQLNQGKRTQNDLLTVELDDDEVPTHNSSPQWYLRPEEQAESLILEDENNKEPERTKLIEITIEDSPVKPLHNKRTNEVGAELAITIEDSPVKAVADKTKEPESGSDNEDNIGSINIPQSKKKLEYPKETEDRRIVEIEIDPVVISEINVSSLNRKSNDALDTLIENKNNTENIKKCNAALPNNENKKLIEVEVSKPSEFHPVYQTFIDLCFRLENSDDMKKIVEKKIKGYYRQVPKVYTESEEFIDMVSSKTLSMKAGPEKMYLYIKDIVDELNLQRKLAKSRPVEEVNSEELIQICSEESEYDSKRQRQIRKLEKTIKKLSRAIQKLEEQEVDFDDEDDSVYLLTERYKERMVRVYAKFCQLTNTKMPSEPRIQIDARPGQPSGPAKRLEKWINKKVPIGTPLPFPDFHDVLRCVREANNEDKLNFNEADIMEEARDLFTRCGRKLQRRRQENEWRLAASRIALDIDPAEDNDELKRKLNENKKMAAQKETEIFNKFADRQNQLKLEAEEIGDKEAEESPVESEEEEANDENDSLENTEQRKERLKRLLHDKSKKASEEKENQPSNDEVKKDDGNAISETAVTADNTVKAETEDKQRETNEEDGSKENTESSKNDENSKLVPTETYTLSDDSNELESDIDELHLLQRLHSPNAEQSSTADSSDSDCRIAISDSLACSEGDVKNSDSDYVFSIENSSYSEDEGSKIDNAQESNTDSIQIINDDNMADKYTETTLPAKAIEVDLHREGDVQALTQTNNYEYTEAVENILLASSEDDNSQEGITEEACVNLRDDLISIDETVIGNINNVSEILLPDQPNATIQEKDTDNILVEENNEVLPPNVDNMVENGDDKKSDEPKEAIQDNDVVIADEKSNKSIEKMDVDQEENATNGLETVTPENNVPSTSVTITS